MAGAIETTNDQTVSNQRTDITEQCGTRNEARHAFQNKTNLKLIYFTALSFRGGCLRVATDEEDRFFRLRDSGVEVRERQD